MTAEPARKRVLLKVSGEALMGKREYGLDSDTLVQIATDIASVGAQGHEVCLVIGGGNIFRGISAAARGMDRAQADYMGMIATVMNALGMQNALEKMGVPTRVLSAIPMASVCEPYIRRRAMRHMEKGRVVIFAAGTGNPFLHHRHRRRPARRGDGLRHAAEGHPGGWRLFRRPAQAPGGRTVRAAELPRRAGERDLAVMDAAAISVARENGMPIVVFNIHAAGAFAQVMRGEGRFTTIIEKS